jgi:hypothetical protein
MALVATWEDGPEYAPVEWPTGFVAPEIGPLSVASSFADPSADAPAEPPARFDPPHDPVPALATLVPTTAPTRDPAEPFQVVSAVVTAGSAWGSAHSTQAIATPEAAPMWTPDQAVAPNYPPPPPTQGFPSPGTPGWFGPPTAYEANRVHVPLTVSTVAEGLSWGLIIALVLGGIIAYLSPVLLVIAFFLAGQARYRHGLVRIGVILAMVIVVIAGAGAMVGTSDSTLAWESMDTASVWSCWLLIVYGLAISAFAIRSGERPES